MKTKEIELDKSKISIKFISLKNELKQFLDRMGFKDEKEFDGLLGRLACFKEPFIEEEKIIEIISIIEKTSKLYKEELKSENIDLFIFKTEDKFITDKMHGSSGFCTNKRAIIILLNPKEFSEKSLKNTFAHELAHALNNYYDMGNMSIEEGIIFDGLAENFRENTLDNKPSEIVSNLSREEALKLFVKIKPILKNRDFDSYSNVFFGKGEYPLWAGYSIGYYLIKDYVKKLKSYKWKDLLKMNPEELMKSISVD